MTAPQKDFPTPMIRPRRSAFSLVELMVVISIIAVLVGLLLVALAKVRTAAAITETKSTMRSFSGACDNFHQNYGRYPGVIPERELHRMPSPPLSTTESAMLDLMGGYRVLRPDSGPRATSEYDAFVASGAVDTSLGSDWRLATDRNRMGEGPVVNGLASSAFFTPSSSSFGVAAGQAGSGFNGQSSLTLPDLLDAWGQPMLYIRRQRERGPLLSETNDPADPAGRPQFLIAGLSPYLRSTASSNGSGLGNLGQNQVYDAGSNPAGSILSESVGTPEYLRNFAYILRHPGLVTDPNPALVMTASTSRSGYVIISAGPDGIFFSAEDGPGAPGDGVTDLSSLAAPDRAVEEYDDIRSFGGG